MNTKQKQRMNQILQIKTREEKENILIGIYEGGYKKYDEIVEEVAGITSTGYSRMHAREDITVCINSTRSQWSGIQGKHPIRAISDEHLNQCYNHVREQMLAQKA